MKINKTKPLIIEACVTSVRSAVAAQEGGALRVELCDNLYDGGTTPGPGSILAARKHLHIGLNVIIRPRGGDFLYTDLEYGIMVKDLEFCRENGADGVVFGILDSKGRIDMKRNARLVELAGEMTTTFHRAFDVCQDPMEGLDDLIELGIDRVLTSGHKPSAMEGVKLIERLVNYADDRIIIMPGVGIDATNIGDLIRQCKASEYHVYQSSPVASGMEYQNPDVFMGTDPELSEYHMELTDSRQFKAICEAADRAWSNHFGK